MEPVRCKAKSKQSGEQCKCYAMPGKEVCAIHGGKTPSGIASPHFQGKGYGKRLPLPLRKQYLDALADPELLSLRKEVAVIQTQLHELSERLHSGESEALWEQLKKAWDGVVALHDSSDAEEKTAAMRAVNDLIKGGSDIAQARREWLDLVEAKGKVSQREWKRLVDLRQMITAERALEVVTSIGLIIKRNVSSQQELRAISREIENLFLGPRGAKRVENEAPDVPPPV